MSLSCAPVSSKSVSEADEARGDGAVERAVVAMVKAERGEQPEPLEQEAAAVAEGRAGAEHAVEIDGVAVEPAGISVEAELRGAAQPPSQRARDGEALLLVGSEQAEGRIAGPAVAP